MGRGAAGGDRDPFHGTVPNPDAPYWRRHYGMGHRWQPSPRGRQGCMLLLVGGFALVVLGVLIALVAGTF